MASEHEVKPDKTLDVRGDVCPRPLLLTMMALRGLAPGQVLRIVGDYGPSLAHIVGDAKSEGQTVLRARMLGEAEWEVIIRKQEE